MAHAQRARLLRASGGRTIGNRVTKRFLSSGHGQDSADPTALTCLALLPPEQHDTAVLRLNDGRCDTAGRFWAGSVITPRTAPNAALWCLQADASSATGYSVRHMAGDNFTANGLAFSPDNCTCIGRTRRNTALTSLTLM